MKNHPCSFLALGLLFTGGIFAQPSASPEVIPAPPGAVANVALTAEQLDQLLGPIALYPDALIALILPAATYPSDVVLAARYLNGGDPAGVDDQPWDDSVRALAHYPDVVKWMDENLRWTQQLGQAFLGQPAEVMKAVQHLRAEARAAGTLVDTPQQQVVTEGETVVIVPTQPDVIYVPYYDPEVVYVRRASYPGPFFSFSIGYPTGFWLGYNFDWRQRRLWVVERRERERFWREQHDWRRPVFPAHPTVVEPEPVRHVWTPPVQPHLVRPPSTPARAAIVHPAPISRGTPHVPEEQRRENSARRVDASQPPPIPFASISTPAPGAPPPQPQPSQVISRGTREAPPQNRRPEDNREIRDREQRTPATTPNNVPVPPPPPGMSRMPAPAQPPAPVANPPAPQNEPRRVPPKQDSDDDGKNRRQSDRERDR